MDQISWSSINNTTMKQSSLYFALLFILSSCTTIDITEQDAFDNYRTITPATFNFSNYTLHDQMIETEDGEQINAWFLEHENAVATVLYLGGNGFLMVKSHPLIEAYSNIPVNLMIFDYRGYGLSSGNPSVAGIQMDAKTALRFVKENAPVSPDQIFVHGHSMGSFLSAYLADTESIDGYILESPITEVDSWTKKLVPWILRPIVRFDIDPALSEQSNLKRVEQIEIPLLIMGGSDDDITPFRMAQEIEKRSASSQKRLLKITGGKHNDLPTYLTYWQALDSFFMESLDN